ncbi:MAG TPA: efflux RND transporter periplasmic adaptor subunit [Flavobacterium sp.]|nr:efflux RND transporter periplasmic adaptor subunit [Flavobacterium sp.]MBP6437693.1 efflux RND transporter periplasmic adaptor subunit [Paludibacteraceae bacterium]MBP7319340.1 efflux RND transporter periplasmic adaptor subunit [Flavobacterium sp.]MBP8888324.1 efflux RND transporter periplasmic adaptor subunit [Flavobacterium sp.]HRL72557.1 efflux RND transporter periplasmic adaptor subunit [Flavobacterium sp.]
MNKYIKYSLAFFAISIIGIAIYLFALKSENHSEIEHQNEVYTCSMHPQIIRDKPGNCPICGMTLVKKITENNSVQDNSIDNLIKPTDNFIVGNYQTTTAIDTTISSEINLPGIVAYDPNSSVNIAARMSGRIERMYVNYKYQKVNKGQKLFDLYSPELLTEQQNFIYMVINDADNISIINASKQKLLLYGMTQNQINTLITSKTANPRISIYSPASGIIDGTETMANVSTPAMQSGSNSTEILNVKEGNYIKKGEVIFKLLNTDKVWGIFNVIQGYNSLIKTSQSIQITTELDKNEVIDAQINFVETQLNPADKTNRIRVYLNNNKLKLPIGLRLQGIVKTNAVNGIWIQKQSMVSIGNKKIVFLKMENGFKASSIKTGIEMDDFIQIIEGISIKDTIAKNAQYLIDSESFIKTE